MKLLTVATTPLADPLFNNKMLPEKKISERTIEYMLCV